MKNITLSLLLILISYHLKAQSGGYGWTVSEKQTMPMPVSNNAVALGFDANAKAYMYSFGGIDSTKIWSGINLKSFRYDIANDVWDTLPNLPDTLGKIAAGASYIDSIIYIIGGYHVFANSNEISSNKVHRFNTRTNSYMTDATPIPVAIDDHVQAVYKDSLIYVVTGWSNTTNVPNVQIYDVQNDTWLIGTSTPNNNTYKAFGATGTILGDTLYYHGGASTGFNFPIQSSLRKGYINPTSPTQITWTSATTSFFTYRAVAFPFDNEICFLGGSSTTYNFNGIAYNGSGGVAPRNKLSTYDIFSTQFTDSIPLLNEFGLPFQGVIPMDLRGIAFDFNIGIFLCGGMLENQLVSNKTFQITFSVLDAINENRTILFKTFPNPTNQTVRLVFEDTQQKTLELTDLSGKSIFIRNTSEKELNLDVSSYPKGIYLLKVMSNNKIGMQKIIIQ